MSPDSFGEPIGFLDSRSFERDVILTGSVTVRVTDRESGRPAPGLKVVLLACGFT